MEKSIISQLRYKLSLITIVFLFALLGSCSQHAKISKSDQTQVSKRTNSVAKSKKAKVSNKIPSSKAVEKSGDKTKIDSLEDDIVLAEVDQVIEESKKSNSEKTRTDKTVKTETMDIDTSELVKILIDDELNEIDSSDYVNLDL